MKRIFSLAVILLLSISSICYGPEIVSFKMQSWDCYLLINTSTTGDNPMSCIQLATGSCINFNCDVDWINNQGTVEACYSDFYRTWSLDNHGAAWGDSFVCLKSTSGEAPIDSEDESGTFELHIHDTGGTKYWPAGSDYVDWYEILENAWFENYSGTPDDGSTDNFTSWGTSTRGTGSYVDATEDDAHAEAALYLIDTGVHMHQVLRGQASINQTFDVSDYEGDTMYLSFSTKGDGGRWKLYDVTNSEDIVAITDLNASGSSWECTYTSFVVPEDCEDINIAFYTPNTTVACDTYVDDVCLYHEHMVTDQHVISLGWRGVGQTPTSSGTFYSDSDRYPCTPHEYLFPHPYKEDIEYDSLEKLSEDANYIYMQLNEFYACHSYARLGHMGELKIFQCIGDYLADVDDTNEWLEIDDVKDTWAKYNDSWWWKYTFELNEGVYCDPISGKSDWYGIAIAFVKSDGTQLLADKHLYDNPTD